MKSFRESRDGSVRAPVTSALALLLGVCAAGGAALSGAVGPAQAAESSSAPPTAGRPPEVHRLQASDEAPTEKLHGRELALATMKITQEAPVKDFLAKNGIRTPMPVVQGALPDHARVPFPSDLLMLPVDLMVIFTIGDFDPSRECSDYYAPDSAWYNVFYGAYGVLSNKQDGSWWGYDVDGKPDFHEMIEVPELDYNVLTAGQLGCPKEKRIFEVLELKKDKFKVWDWGKVAARIPSGLHRVEDMLQANPLYYSIFGAPDPKLIGNRPSYEPVKMRGEIFFRRVTEVTSRDRITLVWGAMCPDTPKGGALLKGIIDTMKPLYQ